MSDQTPDWTLDHERLLRSAMREYRYLVSRIVKLGEDIEDITQYLRVEVWRKLKYHSDKRSELSTFIYLAAKSELLKLLAYCSRQKRKGWSLRVPLYMENEEGELVDYIEDPSPSPEQLVQYRELLSRARDILMDRYGQEMTDLFFNAMIGNDVQPMDRRLKNRIANVLRRRLRE